MKNSKTYIIVLGLLAAIAAILYFSKTWSTTDNTETAFSYADTGAITQVILTDNQKRKLKLTRKNEDTWLVNDGYKARPDAINTLLSTFAQLRLERPISNAAYPNVIKMFDDPQRTVQIFTKDPGNPAHEYYIGGVTNDKMGTYIMLKGASKPYIVTIPGLEGNLLSRHFTLAEEWRDRLLFNLHYAQIAEVKAEYPENPENGFLLTVMEKDSFTVAPVDASAKISNPKAILNKPLLMSYLNSFKELYAEAFENGYPRTDSLRNTLPYCKLSVTDKNGKTKAIQIHYLPNNRRSKRQVNEDGTPILTDPDRYLAFINNGGDLVMIQQFVFGKLFRRYQDFIIIPKS